MPTTLKNKLKTLPIARRIKIIERAKELLVKEKWLWENKTALQKVKKGLQDSAAGRVKSTEKFAKFVGYKT